MWAYYISLCSPQESFKAPIKVWWHYCINRSYATVLGQGVQMGSCDRLEITFTNCFAQQMTLWVYSSVAYIVCILDNEGKRFEKVMCPEGLLTPPLFKLKSSVWKMCTPPVLQGQFQEGERPPQQISQNAPPLFFSITPAQLELDHGACAVGPNC